MCAGGTGFPLHFRPPQAPALLGRWSVLPPAAGDKPQPYIRTAALPPAYIRSVVGVSLAVGDVRRRYRVPALHLWWSVFRRRRGTSPSPTLGRRRCRRRLGMSAGHTLQGSGPPRWSVFRWRLGMRAPAVVVVSLAVGEGAGGSGPPTSGGRCFAGGGDKPQPYIRTGGGGRRTVAAGGAGFRRLPRPVVGVPPAAGDKPQPYIRTVALPPGRRSLFRWWLGMCAGGTGFRPSTSGGRVSAGGGGRAPALQGAPALPPAVHWDGGHCMEGRYSFSMSRSEA